MNQIIFFNAPKNIFREDLLSFEGIFQKSSLQVLNNVLIKKSGMFVSFTVTDIEIEISIVVPYGVGDIDVSTTCNLKILVDSVKQFPYQDIQFGFDGNSLIVLNGAINLKLHTIQSNEFPLMSIYSPSYDNELCKVSAKSLFSLLTETHSAMAKQDIRFYLNGMLLSFFENTIVSVATNGHYLSYSALKIDHSTFAFGQKAIELLLPSKLVFVLMKLLVKFDNEVKINFDGHKVIFNHKNYEILAKPIEGKFPDYQRVIPTDYSEKILINRKEILTALQRASIFTKNNEFKGITLFFSSEGLNIQALYAKEDKFSEIVASSYRGGNFNMGVSVEYLTNVLTYINDEEVIFNVVVKYKKGVIMTITIPNRDDYKTVIMPTNS